MSRPGTPKFGDVDDFDAPVLTTNSSTNSAAAATASASASASSSLSSSSATPLYTSEVVEEIKSFDKMDLPSNLLRGIYGYGFEKPSEIQSKVIVPMKARRDVLAQAPSGTGKTGGFLIGILSNMDPTVDEVQAGVLAPTRELADQIYTVAKGLVTHMGIRVHLAVGGGHVDADLAKLRRGSKEIPHLLIATPGRFYDLLNRKAINPRTFKALILDEADQLLDAKFKEQIYCILSDPFKWTEETQIGLFSATMIPAIAAVANTLLARNPLKILRDPEEVSLEGISQYYLLVDRPEHKLEALCDLSDCLTFQQCTIFVNTQKEAENLCDAMIGRGFDVSCIHGDMEPKERKRVMDAFRLGKIRVLIATDLIGRGIDVQQISLVINFQLPVQHSNYIHRIGRSGRFGRKGASINIVDQREMRVQEEIEAFYGKKIAVLPMDLKIY